MLEPIKKRLTEEKVFDGTLPPILSKIVDAIPNQGIPSRMKYTIAISELILFASHMRKNIAHWNGSLIPINTISFSISGSGTGKDSSVKAARKCFSSGYQILDKKRKDIATEKAIKLATLAGKENPEDWAVYKEFWRSPDDLFASPDSTLKGLIKHFNALEDSGIGAGFLYSGEVGSEMSSGMKELFRFMAEVYDEGSKEVKLIGDKSEQLKPLKNLPVSALFVGSQVDLLFDESIKAMFKREFSGRLARRSIFNFSPETIPSVNYGDDLEAMLDADILLEERALQARKIVDETVKDIAKHHMNTIGGILTVDSETHKLFLLYKRYNEELAETISAKYPIAKIARLHMQWKGLKIAGAIAIFNKHDSIQKSDYISAISFIEMVSNDLQNFERELVKEAYEVFVDYVHYRAVDGKFSMGLHDIRKLGYIPTTGQPKVRMRELVSLASSYDKEGIYTVCEEGICYEAQVKTELKGTSAVEVSGTKAQRQKQCANGFIFHETSFEDLSILLSEDYAYTPFQFKGGKRSNENLIGGCSYVVLDIDDSKITDEEAHFLLSDINHHIARTSDPNNAFKFRVLIELDVMVDIPSIQWKHFISDISEHLSLTPDILPKAQIYFSYEGRTVLSTLDAEPLKAKQFIVSSAEKLANNAPNKPTALPKAQQQALLNDQLGTFFYAFDAKDGAGSRAMIRAAKHAKDLGGDQEYVCNLIKAINAYWTTGMKQDRLEKTILSQIRRMF